MSSAYIAIHSAFGLMLLWVFVFYFWRDYRVDAFRDHVFSIRDRLFLFAARGGVSFDDPAYTCLRYRMNVVLRYAHRFTLTGFFVTLLHPSRFPSFDRTRWEGALKANADPDTCERLREFDTILSIAILQLMLYRSFLLYLLLRPILRFVEPREVMRSSPNVVSSVEQVEAEALEEEARRRAKDGDAVLVG